MSHPLWSKTSRTRHRQLSGDPRGAAELLVDWRLVRLLGRGAFANVYQARPAGHGEDHPADYAIKLLRPEFAEEPLAVAGLARQAALAQRIDHPHVVTVLDAQLQAEEKFIVMPYLEGVTLRTVIDAPARAPLHHILWIVRQLAQGLSAMHELGWFHADIKPENAIVSPLGHATLIDLGLARPVRQCTPTKELPLVGSLNYTAPEMLSSVHRADARSDIYSLGVVLYELAAGRLPFAGDCPAQVAAAHMDLTPRDPRRLNSQLPTEVARLIAGMLRKDPLRRPANADELVRRLCQLEIAALCQRVA